MKVNVYIDGFNLYYGSVKGTPYRWLNVAEMCRLLLPHDQILQIKYFTALVNPRRSDPDQRSRQETFLCALNTIPSLSIVYGFFLTHEIMMPLAPTRSRLSESDQNGREGFRCKSSDALVN